MKKVILTRCSSPSHQTNSESTQPSNDHQLNCNETLSESSSVVLMQGSTCDFNSLTNNTNNTINNNNIESTSIISSPKRTRKIYKRTQQQQFEQTHSNEQQIHLLRIQSLTMADDESDSDDIVIPPPLTIHDSPIPQSLNKSTTTSNNNTLTNLTNVTITCNNLTTSMTPMSQQLPIMPIRTIDSKLPTTSKQLDSIIMNDEDDTTNMIDEDYEEPIVPIRTVSSHTTTTSTNSTGRRKKRNTTRAPIASHSTQSNTNTANNTAGTNSDGNNTSSDDSIEIASGPTQTLCCLKGCDHAISNRLRFSLRTCKDSDFKVDYMNKGFNWVCNYHYFHDLYLHKKSQKNNSTTTSTSKNSSTTTKRKRSKSNANTTSTAASTKEDPATIVTTTTSLPIISVTPSPQQQAFETTITNMIPSLLHSNLLLSSQPVPTVSNTNTTKRKRSNSNVNTAKKSKTIAESVVLNTSMNFQTSTNPSSTSSLISSSKMTFGNNTASGVATKKKNLKVSTQELTLSNPNYAQPSPVNTDDVMALINFSMGISM